MYFPRAEDTLPNRSRVPPFTSRFPRLTSLVSDLLGDETAWLLPFHLRLGSHAGATTSLPHKTELLVRRRGKDSVRAEFSLTTPLKSRFLFAMNGVGAMDGELFRTEVSDANEPDDDDDTPDEDDGHGVRWCYNPYFSMDHSCPLNSYIDFFWERTTRISKGSYMRGSFLVGGLLPFATTFSSGFNLGASLLSVRGPYAIGVDCQLRGMWLDLTGGRCHLNTVLAYQRPSFSLNLNMLEFGDRFLASAVVNPVGILKKGSKPSDPPQQQPESAPATDDLYSCRWLVGLEADFAHHYGYSMQRLTLAFTHRHLHPPSPTSPSPSSSSSSSSPIDQSEAFKPTDDPHLLHLLQHETKLKLDLLRPAGQSAPHLRLALHHAHALPLGSDARLRVGASAQADLRPSALRSLLDSNAVRVGFVVMMMM